MNDLATLQVCGGGAPTLSSLYTRSTLLQCCSESVECHLHALMCSVSVVTVVFIETEHIRPRQVYHGFWLPPARNL